MKPLKVIGLNSGTSMDGVDAALFLIRPASGGRDTTTPALDVQMLASLLYPFDSFFQNKLSRLVASGESDFERACRLDVALGEIFARAALDLITSAGLTPLDVDLIGSHGQTVWHAPAARALWGVPTRATLQLGEPAVIAARTGIPVIGDFRPSDMAVGGQGAPLVAFADKVLFGRSGVATAVLNLGGIANITAIDASGEAFMAFDTGPGNMIIDRAARLLFDRDHDPEGSLAAAGNLDGDWLADLLAHPYFSEKPPKTTGREVFGQHFADGVVAAGLARGLDRHDVLMTVTALTAASVADAYKRFILPASRIGRLVLGGGGAENATLTRLLSQFWTGELQLNRHEDFGISTKFKEALLFALLAYTTYFGIPNNVPRCTGASRRVCMGKLCRP